jgi:uncharacterized protein (DUF433 family)
LGAGDGGQERGEAEGEQGQKRKAGKSHGAKLEKTGRRRKPGLASDVFWGSVGFMNREQLLQRIWIDPGRCGGQPCIRGHRIWVSLILDLLAAGESVETILEDYPGISREDVQACIAYGSEMARERFVEIPLEPAGA